MTIKGVRPFITMRLLCPNILTLLKGAAQYRKIRDTQPIHNPSTPHRPGRLTRRIMHGLMHLATISRSFGSNLRILVRTSA
jgi:hypothetical protein